MSHAFLIVRLGALGDVIHAIPTAAALRTRFPEARIDWLVEPHYVPLLEMVQGLDSPIGLDTRQPAKTIATLRDLRRVGYSAAIDLQGLLKSAVLARAVGAERTIGFSREHLRERTAAPFYTHTVDPAGINHVIFKNLALLEPLGSRDRSVVFPLTVRYSTARDQVTRRLGGAPYALVNPGAAWPNKRWPPERFGAVTSVLEQRFGLRSLVLWGPGERELAERVAQTSGGAAELAPETSVTDLFAIARGARLLLSGDTGPLHIGGAVGVPLVAVFGPTRAERNGPWSSDDIVIARTATCECLYKRRCSRASQCVDDIQVPEVIDAIERRLSRS